MECSGRSIILFLRVMSTNSVQLFDANSPMCFKHIRRQGAEKLVVSFTGMGKRVPFDFYKTFTNLDEKYDVLFLSDPNEKFYTKGVRGFADTEKDIWMNILKLGLYKKYYFVGTSMGGYAAAYHGNALAHYAEHHFAPQINLLLLNPYIDPTIRLRKYGTDLTKVLRSSPKFGKIWLIYGGKESDILQANLLRWTLPTTATCYAECMDHNIAGWMKSAGLLLPLIKEFLN